MCGKLFSSCRTRTSTGFSRFQNKWLELLVYRIGGTCPERSIDHMSRWVFASFLCVLSLSWVLGKIINLCCDTGSLRRNTLCIVGKAPLFLPHSQYISCYNITKDRERIPSLKVKILINSCYFLMVFWMRPLLPFNWHSVFSKWKLLR